MPEEAPSYEYNSLGSLPDSGKVNVYGAVENVVIRDDGGSIVKIEDEEASVIVRIAQKSGEYFKNLRAKDIVRIHRAEVGSNQNERVLIVHIAKHGCHAVIWRGDLNVPVMTTSESYTFSDQDANRLSSLRGWLKDRESYVRSEVFQSKENLCSDIPADKQKISRKGQLCPTIASATEIPGLGSRFFNWYAQVLGVYKAKGDMFAVFVRSWDGTKPRFNECRNMFHADNDSVETTYCEISKTLYHLIESYIIDVCCYGNWAEMATRLKIGDIIFLGNIRNYVCHSNKISAVTLHEGGLRFNRALNVVNINDPKYFDVSKRCADVLSLYPELSGSLVEGFAEDIITPIISDDVQARSSPKVILNHKKVSLSNVKEHAVEELTDSRMSTSNEVHSHDKGIMPTDFSVDEPTNKNTSSTSCIVNEIVRSGEASHSDIDAIETCDIGETMGIDECSQWLDARLGPCSKPDKRSVLTETLDDVTKNSLVEEDIVCGDQQRIREDSLDVEIQEFLGELGRDDFHPDELLEIADFRNKIRHGIVNAFFEHELAKLCKCETSDKELREEIDGILKMNVGERVSIVNFVGAELSFLTQENYLRNALLFTATCVKCGDEAIVERLSKNWCRKCFKDHECLSAVQYSYRLVVPSIFAFGGAVGQLNLALDGSIWEAALPDCDHLSIRSVMQLYSESDPTYFTEKLDRVLESAEGIMKQRKFSVTDGKLMALDRIKGSVLIFVDRCLVADMNS